MDPVCFSAVMQVPEQCFSEEWCWRDFASLSGPLTSTETRDVLDWPTEDLDREYPWFKFAVHLSQVVFMQLMDCHHILFPHHIRPCIYLQAEPSNSEGNIFHLHLVASKDRKSGREFAKWLKNFRALMATYVLTAEFPLCFNLRKTSQGRLYQSDYSFIRNYLLPKLPLQHCVWGVTNIDRFHGAVLSVIARQGTNGTDAIALPYDLSSAHAEQEARVDAPVMAGKSADRFLKLIDWLVLEGIATEKKWLAVDKVSYRTFLACSGGVLQARNALAIARREMVLTHNLLDYLAKSGEVMGPENRVARLFKLNGYDPETAAWYCAAWARGVWPKRRALWLWGPASTGKTLLAAAIATLSPSYGCVNWTNQNFPFNDCHCQSLIWWEEGRMTENMVEVAKAILGGAPVRLDVKNKGSEDFLPTAVIITSNGDLTVTVDGPVMSTAHQEALQTRITMFELLKTVPEGLAPITEKDIRDFFRAGEELLSLRGNPPETFRAPQRSETGAALALTCLHQGRYIEEAATWDSEDDWFPPPAQSRKRRRTGEDSASTISAPTPPPNSPEEEEPTVTQIVSAPFPPDSPAAPEEEETLSARYELEIWWWRLLDDIRRAETLFLMPPKGPGHPPGYGLFYTALWLKEPWRYRCSLKRAEAHIQNRFFEWAHW
uniref:Nonstructural protein 1 n=1 Tax=Rodent tetraparvovirus TaxID=2137541 RepID=A0A2Z3DB46_9VIRU|nr:nonstructural protein 1 [Rodent tetraparvovirus]